MNKLKKIGRKIVNSRCRRGLFVIGAMLGSGVALRAADPTDVAGAVTALQGNIDSVGTTGIKAYMIAGGLALVGVTIAFIKKAKR